MRNAGRYTGLLSLRQREYRVEIMVGPLLIDGITKETQASILNLAISPTNIGVASVKNDGKDILITLRISLYVPIGSNFKLTYPGFGLISSQQKLHVTISMRDKPGFCSHISPSRWTGLLSAAFYQLCQKKELDWLSKYPKEYVTLLHWWHWSEAPLSWTLGSDSTPHAAFMVMST